MCCVQTLTWILSPHMIPETKTLCLCGFCTNEGGEHCSLATRKYTGICVHHHVEAWRDGKQSTPHRSACGGTSGPSSDPDRSAECGRFQVRSRGCCSDRSGGPRSPHWSCCSRSDLLQRNTSWECCTDRSPTPRRQWPPARQSQSAPPQTPAVQMNKLISSALILRLYQHNFRNS